MPEISIIVPVYNTAKSLEECLNSILRQTISNLEIICINDGSTDNSLDILRAYAATDARIKIVNQINQGVSAARNAGLEIAKGKYIGFVDSDDDVESAYFERLVGAANINGANVIYAKAFTDDTLKKNIIYNRQGIIKDFLPAFLERDHYNSVCNKIYEAVIIQKYKLFFPVDKKLGEDAEFNLKFLENTNCLYYLDYSGYNYREVVGSATRNVSTQKYLEDAVQQFNEEPTDFIKKNISSERIYTLKSTRFIHYVMSLVYIYSAPGNGISIIHKLKNLDTLVKNSTVAKVFAENEAQSKFGLYQKQIHNFIKSKGVIPLYFLSLYSYFRNL